MKRIPYDPKDWCPHEQYLYNETPTLGEVIRDLEWGTNKSIRLGGIRIQEKLNLEIIHLDENHIIIVSENGGLYKIWSRINDPYYKIKSGTLIGCGNPPHIAMIWVGDDEYYM